MKKILLALLSSALCSLPLSSFSQKGPIPAHWHKGVTYEIFVRAFADSNGDGIGDIKGMTRRLDYLQELGVKGVWLMPISPAPSYHKYDVVDYKDIDPEYGTMADFKQFVKEAHARDIKVILDMVPNHSSSLHPWFQAAMKDPNSPYRDYYVWQDSAKVRGQEHWYSPKDASGKILGGQKYYGFFWHGMPDLNYDNPKVRAEMIEAGRFWLKEVGIDGFRLDAVRHVYPDAEAAKNHAWWREFRRELDKVKPGFFTVGEVWAPDSQVAPYLQQGLHSVFNFDLSFALVKALQTGDAAGLAPLHKRIQNLYQTVDPAFVDATFLTNHDQNRIMSEVAGNTGKAKVAAALLLTLPGSPFLYYGEELGMTGMKPDEYIREPFLWADSLHSPDRTRWISPKYNTQETLKPLQEQQKDQSSLWHHYKTLISLREKNEALHSGVLKPIILPLSQVSAFRRISPTQRLVVVHNTSDKEVTVAIPGLKKRKTKLLFASQKIIWQKDQVVLPGYGSVVLEEK